jgi:hypothetical protein
MIEVFATAMQGLYQLRNEDSRAIRIWITRELYFLKMVKVNDFTTESESLNQVTVESVS